MSKDNEIAKQLEEELEGYDEAVVLKIRSLYQNKDLSIDETVNEYDLTEDDYDLIPKQQNERQ